MRLKTVPPAILRPFALAFGLLLAAAPAWAQWSSVPAVPVTNVYSLFVNADTIVAGVDTAQYVSTNVGASWTRTSKPAPSVVGVTASWLRNGRLYAGTFGQGVFVSDNLGTTWQAFNQGLVGGFLDSQLDINDLQQRGDSLYAATAGAGVYVRGFAPAETWHHFGEDFEPNQASNVIDLALGGTRLVASAGPNGSIFHRDPGEPEWTISWLNNVGLDPGLEGQDDAWNGSAWAVATVKGVFRSTLGQEPWTLSDPGLGPIQNTAFATQGRRIYAGFSIPNFGFMEFSDDDGANWHLLESLLHVFVFRMAVVGNTLYAGRGDGLWVRSIGNVSAPAAGGAAGSLSFALAGANPVGDTARLRFELPEAGPASIEVFDVRGRRVGPVVHTSFAAGPNEIQWSARDLSPGVYSARLLAQGRQGVVRLVHVR